MIFITHWSCLWPFFSSWRAQTNLISLWVWLVTWTILSLAVSYAWPAQARLLEVFKLVVGWLHCGYLLWLNCVWLGKEEAVLHCIMQLGMIGCLYRDCCEHRGLVLVCLPLHLYERRCLFFFETLQSFSLFPTYPILSFLPPPRAPLPSPRQGLCG